MKQEMKEYNEVLKDLIKKKVTYLMFLIFAMFMCCLIFVLACMRSDCVVLYVTTFLSAVTIVSSTFVFLKARKILYDHFKFMEDVAEVTDEFIK